MDIVVLKDALLFSLSFRIGRGERIVLYIICFWDGRKEYAIFWPAIFQSPFGEMRLEVRKHRTSAVRPEKDANQAI